MMEKFTLRFKDSSFWGLVICALIQQALVASSSYWLVSFSGGLEQGLFQPTWLILFLLSLLLPYYPGAAALYLLKKFELRRLSDFWAFEQQRILARLDLRNDSRLRSTVAAVQIKDGPQLMSDLIHFGYELGSTALNAALNVFAVSFLVSPTFLLSYSVSLVLVAILIKVFSEQNMALAGAAEGAKTVLNGVLARAWENLTVNNRSNREIWTDRYRAGLERWSNASLQAESTRHFTSIVLTSATFVPTLLTLAWFTYSHQNQLNELLAMTVLLPRIYMILNHTSSLIYLARDISIFRGRLDQLVKNSELPPAQSLAGRIQYDQLTLNGQFTDEPGLGAAVSPVYPVSSVVARDLRPESLPASGWITIRGPNGAGKSTFLIQLKQALGDKAFYYPAHSDLDFRHEGQPLSTGQKTITDLEEVLSMESAPILLLDEWDANLDTVRKSHIEGRLRDLSRTRLILDIRH